MAIRMRRGVFDNFDPTRMLPGEWAVVLSGDPDAADGYAVYMCFAPGSVKRMATYEDMVENVDEATADIIQAALDGLAEEIAHINAEALPDMSAGQRGIAKLGSGLAMANSALSVDPITSAQIDSVAADASMAGSQSLSLTGLTRIWAKIKAAFAAIAHSHAAADITSGTLAVARGGTGASSTAAARTSLDAAQSEGAAGSLYDAEQAIADLAAATGNVSVATDGSLQSQVNTLRESVSSKAGYTIEYARRDLNDLVIPGIYAVNSAQTTHAPTGVEFAGSVLVMTYGGDYMRVFQLYMSCGDYNNAPIIHVRHSYYSSGSRAWGPWSKLL